MCPKSLASPLKPVELATYRLSPWDDVLEKRLVLAEGALWVPAIPDSMMHIGDISWRKRLFNYAHATLLNPHRAAGESYQLLRRMGFWDTLGTDFNKWFSACEACQRYRARPVQPPLRSTTADDRMRSKLPWTDVIIDVQGPYTRAEGGEMYVLSYHCTVLRVPKLEAFKSLQAGFFSRALVSCVLKTRVIPDVVRSDRGPEMTSRVNREFMALCGCEQLYGSAFTPRRQGPVEQGHQTVAKVIKNLPADERVLVQPFKGVWRHVRACHIPLYVAEQGGHITTEPSVRRLEESVRYSALVLQAELLAGGELTYGSARTLSNNGWGLLVDNAEQVAHFRFAADQAPDFAEQQLEGPPGQPGDRAPLPRAGKESSLIEAPVQEVASPSVLVSALGESCEELIPASRGKRVLLRQSAVHTMFLGARAALLEIFCGCMELTLGVRALGLCAPDGVDALFPVGDQPWDLSQPGDQAR